MKRTTGNKENKSKNGGEGGQKKAKIVATIHDHLPVPYPLLQEPQYAIAVEKESSCRRGSLKGTVQAVDALESQVVALALQTQHLRTDHTSFKKDIGRKVSGLDELNSNQVQVNKETRANVAAMQEAVSDLAKQLQTFEAVCAVTMGESHTMPAEVTKEQLDDLKQKVAGIMNDLWRRVDILEYNGSGGARGVVGSDKRRIKSLECSVETLETNTTRIKATTQQWQNRLQLLERNNANREAELGRLQKCYDKHAVAIKKTDEDLSVLEQRGITGNCEAARLERRMNLAFAELNISVPFDPEPEHIWLPCRPGTPSQYPENPSDAAVSYHNNDKEEEESCMSEITDSGMAL